MRYINRNDCLTRSFAQPTTTKYLTKFFWVEPTVEVNESVTVRASFSSVLVVDLILPDGFFFLLHGTVKRQSFSSLVRGKLMRANAK